MISVSKSMRYMGGVICALLMSFPSWADEHSAATEIQVRPAFAAQLVVHPTRRLYQQTRGKWGCRCFSPDGGNGYDHVFLVASGEQGRSAKLSWTSKEKVCKEEEFKTGSSGGGWVCTKEVWEDVPQEKTLTIGSSGLVVFEAAIAGKDEGRLSSTFITYGGSTVPLSSLPRSYSSHRVATHEYASCPSGENCGGTSYHGPISNALWDDLHDYTY